MYFQNKNVIVTGAASGIGRCLSEQLAAQGARVMLTDIQAAPLEALTQTLQEAGHRVDCRPLNVADAEAFSVLVDETIAAWGPLDVLINNAGIGVGGEARDFSYSDWKRVIDVNLYGVIHGVQAAYPKMVAQGFGHIVNVASIAGLVPFAGEISYSASKYAVVGLTHALRAEAAALGVKVTLVCPGKIETPIYETSEVIGFDKEKALSLWPKGITPEQCAAIMLRGIQRNKATVVVTRLARALWWAHRLHPGITLSLAKRYMKQMRAFRLSSTEEET